MDLSNALAAEAGSTEAETTTTTSDDSNESEIPFEANESTEGYALFGNSDKLVGAISTEVFGNDPVYSLLEWDMDLEDYQGIVEENDLNGQQKLDLLHKLAKSTFGERQGQKNEGYGMGWNTDGEGPPTVYDNDKVDHVPYLDVFSHLPAFDHTTLSEGDIEQLEAEGLDMDDFGFDRSVEGPQLPVIDGEMVPIVYEDGDEVETMLRMLNSIDFDEVTYCPKDGELQGTPTLGPSEGDSDNVAEESDDSYPDFRLAEEPERVGEVNVTSLRGQNGTPERLKVSNIDSLRTINTLLSHEERSTAISRLEERRSALQGDEEVDEEDTEGASDDEVSESVEGVEDSPSLGDLSDADKTLVSALLNNGEADSTEEAINEVVA